MVGQFKPRRQRLLWRFFRRGLVWLPATEVIAEEENLTQAENDLDWLQTQGMIEVSRNGEEYQLTKLGWESLRKKRRQRR